MTGERDIRSEDRQLLLDAIGAATEKLVITYTGANEHTGYLRPPPCRWPSCWTRWTDDVNTGTRARPDQASVAAVRRRNVDPGALVPSKPFTFDPTALAAAEAAAGQRCTPTQFITDLLPAPPTDDVILADLLGFFKDPVKGLLPRDSTARCRGTSTV